MEKLEMVYAYNYDKSEGKIILQILSCFSKA